MVLRMTLFQAVGKDRQHNIPMSTNTITLQGQNSTVDLQLCDGLRNERSCRVLDKDMGPGL